MNECSGNNIRRLNGKKSSLKCGKVLKIRTDVDFEGFLLMMDVWLVGEKVFEAISQ